MKKKKIIISAVVAAAAVSVCSASLLMLNTKASDPNHFTDEQKSSMIEERKEEKRKYGGMSTEEKLKAQGEYGMLEELESKKAEANATEEGRQGQQKVKDLIEYYDQQNKERDKVVLGVLKRTGYYPDGFDEERFVKDEDYYLECVCGVCRAYTEQKDNLSADEKSKFEDYLNTAYNNIVYWYPQSNLSEKTYKMIEETLDMETVCRLTEDKYPPVFKYVKRSEAE